MSEKLTRVMLPEGIPGNGYMNWGEHSVEDMIRQLRQRAASLRAEAEEIEAAADAEFQIDVIRGSVVQRHIRELQHSSRKKG